MTNVAIVTGAASGIGAAVSERLVSQGWRVAGLDLNPCSDLEFSVSVDICDSVQVAAAVSSIRERFGAINALITCAGHYAIAPLCEITPDAWTRMLRVHLGGIRNAAHAVLPGMLSQGRGSIVAIASELAIGGGDGDAHYAAAKGCVLGFVRSLAAEVAPQGIRVNAVAPGPTDTPLLAADSPWRAGEYLGTLPVGRLCRPGEVAEVVDFLLSEDADFCVGEVLSPNSGAVI